MASPRARRTLRAPWWAGAAVGALAIGAVVLSVLAFTHVRPEEANAGAAPVPTFSVPTPTPSATPTVTAPPTFDRSGELFLAIGSGASWRAVAGSCGGAEPLLERSTDGGATWRDVTPRYLGIGQIMSLQSVGGTEAIIVAAVGAGCETQALRTFTQGEFWESFPNLLAAARYVDATDAGTVHLTTATVGAPCDQARGLQASDTAVALVCGGLAWQWTGTTWTQLPVDGVAAVAVIDSDIVVAHGLDGCGGTSLTRFPSLDPASANPSECAADFVLGGGDAAAMVADDGEVALWSGSDLAEFATPRGATR